MNKLTLLQKFWALLGIFLIVLAIQLSGLYFTNNLIQSGSRTISSRDIPVLNKAHELKLAVVQVQQWLTDISATRGLDGLNDGFDEAEKNAQKARQLIAELTQLDITHASTYQDILPVFENYYQSGIRMAKAYIEFGPAGGNKMMENFDVAAAAISERVDALLQQTITKTDVILHNQDDTIKNSLIVSGVTSMLLVTAVIFMFVTIWYVVKEIPRLSGFVNKIANGDLGTENINTKRKDEIGNLIIDLNHMKENLVHIIKNVTQSSNNIFTSVDTMKYAVNGIQNEIRHEQSLMDNIVNAVQNMTDSSVEVSRHAQSSADSAKETDSQANECNDIVKQAISSIESVSSEIESGVSVINKMKLESDNIGDILSVIRGIADQTNLLALNAAIEAARAGEQGRGFAVVADEVRSLAQRTQDSIEEINDMIESLQSISNQACDVMERSRATTVDSVVHIKDAGSKLDAIVKSVDIITEMNDQIASAVEEQSMMANRINQTLSDLVNDANNVENGTSEIAVSSDTIFDMASVLKNEIVAFRV